MVEAGQSRHFSSAPPASTKSVSLISISPLPTAKDIRHAPVVSSRVTENEDVAGADPLRQLHVPRHHVVLHAEPAHQTSLAAPERTPLARHRVAPEDAVRLEGVPRDRKSTR